VYSISADSHVTEPGDCYLPRIDPRFRDRAPVAKTDEKLGAVMAIDGGKSWVPYGMIAGAGRPAEKIGPFEHVGWDELHPGGWDPKARPSSRTATASRPRCSTRRSGCCSATTPTPTTRRPVPFQPPSQPPGNAVRTEKIRGLGLSRGCSL
jgi:hypothetical protein